MITRNKKPPSLVRMCISVINLYLPVMAVTEFQAFGTGRWFRIWCSFPLKIRWGELKVTVKKCLRYAPDMDIHASHFSLLPVIPPYMALYLIWKHFPELKGEGCDFKYLYFWAGHLVCQFQMNWLHLHKLIIMRLWIISMNFTSNG